MLGESHKLPSIGNRNRNHFYNFILSKIQLSTIQARNTENIKLKAYSPAYPRHCELLNFLKQSVHRGGIFKIKLLNFFGYCFLVIGYFFEIRNWLFEIVSIICCNQSRLMNSTAWLYRQYPEMLFCQQHRLSGLLPRQNSISGRIFFQNRTCRAPNY